jgi:hypothetical protein
MYLQYKSQWVNATYGNSLIAARFENHMNPTNISYGQNVEI